MDAFVLFLYSVRAIVVANLKGHRQPRHSFVDEVHISPVDVLILSNYKHFTGERARRQAFRK